MRKSIFFIVAALLLCSHDLYVKLDSYFLTPNHKEQLNLYNGTFEKSENIITRDRMRDASIVSNGLRTAILPEQWSDKDSTVTQLSFQTGESGTYVVGVSTKARTLVQTAEKFNSYLEHDGVLDMLAYRKENNLLNQDAVEQYEKHVKAILQVGDTRSNDWNTALGYPIEFVPVRNPYNAHTGDTLSIQLLLDGKPLANQLVGAQHLSSNKAHTHDKRDHHTHSDEEHSHTHSGDEKVHTHNDDPEATDGHTHTDGQQLRTNDQGIVTLDLLEDGIYYIRTIYMSTVETESTTHKSKWATLTFEVTHKHSTATHTHDDGAGIPSYIFWIGSIVVIGLLFFIFKKPVTRA